jgi:subtilisin family serine protease
MRNFTRIIPFSVFALSSLMISTNSKAMTPMRSESLSQKLSQVNLNQNRFSKKKTVKGTILEKNLDMLGGQTSWFNESPQTTNIQGVSSNLAYELFKKPTKKKDIIVAVIDSGVDVNHEDLQGKIWTNENEIPNNGIDDDNNGYIDDKFGWNFIGNKAGMAKFEQSDTLKNGYLVIKGEDKYQVGADSLEMTRVYKKLLDKGSDLTDEESKLLVELEGKILPPYKEAKKYVSLYTDSLEKLNAVIEVIESAGIDLDDWDILEGDNFATPNIKDAVSTYLDYLDQGFDREALEEEIKEYSIHANFYYNINSDTRAEIVKDTDPHYYGNNDVIGPNSFHGTHVSGIIAANRENSIGINGVAQNVKIMAIRAIPNGDERDKDVANAIRYAVDNGARIINMSFGKSYSPDKELVFQAIEYAQTNGVLLIHAAGNETTNNDTSPNFPNKKLNDVEVHNWIEVAASYHLANSRLYPRFSNYGRDTVDLFAPGVRIKSTAPSNSYQTASGTSMASPVVSGVAAMILSYVDLDANSLKASIIGSLNHFDDLQVAHPQLGLVPFQSLSLYGGIPNVVKALDALKIERKEVQVVVPLASTEPEVETETRRAGFLRRFLDRFRKNLNKRKS